MKTEIIKDIRQGFETAYINGTLASNLEYKPSFVSNNPKEGKKVISTIEEELLRCEHFQISVAFITMGGITPLLQTLKELERKGVVGEILTTNYLNFSEPRALEKLNELSNITLKMYDVEVADSGFHTKGYIFKKEEVYRIILGSSNMTSAALTSNIEWNTKIISSEQGEVASEIIKEFNNLWNSDYALDFETFYEIYKVRYELIKHQREEAKKDIVPSFEKYTLKPNSMQEEFIINLRKIIEKGEEKALLISATGTGKTYASAFAVRELGFKRVLFIVHRAQLAKQAKKSFERVFNNSVSMGIVGDGKHEYDSDFIFAMVETLNRDEHLFKYKKDTFDCIILDEAHHSPANTYQKVMEYFKPKLFLGMTATPDKRDDYIEGRNVYELFNHQIAHEIRLQKAMEDDLLCPFHYFGISDIAMLNDKTFKGKIITEKDFNLLTSEERVDHVIEQAQYYGYSGDRVKGLIFCSRNKECESLSKLFNERGYRTLALSNETPQKLRETAFERLAMKEEDAIDEFQPLDYIFSVDILNEGIDIVEVNQVIMLRPTQSPIVFIQQLGRGLRKAEGKEYVVILDFIGNYDNNFMIPVALSGDRTYNADLIRKYVISGNSTIPGASTIHFDEISKDKIFHAIDHIKPKDTCRIRSSYAVGFTKDAGDNSKVVMRKENIRNAFNSPMRPFVLATTSIGQEGLDFHNYCRVIMHWNLPSNPIDLEQREGRINRFKCLAIRQNVADKYGKADEITFKRDIWTEMFEAAKAEKQNDQSELVPFWCFGKNQSVKIERLVPMYPMSKDEMNYERLIKILSLYRLTLGQARQEELLEYLFKEFKDTSGLKKLFIDLSPFSKGKEG